MFQTPERSVLARPAVGGHAAGAAGAAGTQPNPTGIPVPDPNVT